MWQAFLGWIGVDQYDEGNLIGQEFLDPLCREVRCAAGVLASRWANRDVAETLVRAFSDAHPLSPARGQGPGAGEDAACRVRCARHPGVVRQVDPARLDGAGYLVARTLDTDGVNSHLVDRFGEDG